MGANVSSQASEVLNENITQTTKNVLNSTKKTAVSSINASQFQEVHLDVGNSKNCRFEFNQNIKVKSEIYSSLDSQSTTELKDKLENSIKAALTNIVEQKNDGINLFQVNQSNTEQSAIGKNVSYLSDLVSNEVKSSLNSQISTNQNQKIFLKFLDIDCSNSQDKPFLAVTQNADVDSIIKDTLASSNVASLISEIENQTDTVLKAETSQFNVGVFGGIAGLIIALAIIGVIGKSMMSKKKK